MSDEVPTPQSLPDDKPDAGPVDSTGQSPAEEASTDAVASAESAEAAESGEAAGKRKKLPHPREVIDRLAEAWPEAFSRDPRAVRPLAIGILKQILADRPQALDGLNSQAIRRGVKFYTSSIAYHRAMLTATHRVALDGSQADEITEDMRAHAREELERIPKPARKSRGKSEPEGESTESRPRRNRRRRGRDDSGAEGPRGDRPPRRARSDRSAGGKGNGPGSSRPPQADGSAKEMAKSPAQEPQTMEEKLARLARHFSGE
ncbi:MAG: ProQ/FINO family protein [Halothiobacillaceae bacterium]